MPVIDRLRGEPRLGAVLSEKLGLHVHRLGKPLLQRSDDTAMRGGRPKCAEKHGSGLDAISPRRTGVGPSVPFSGRRGIPAHCTQCPPAVGPPVCCVQRAETTACLPANSTWTQYLYAAKRPGSPDPGRADHDSRPLREFWTSLACF